MAATITSGVVPCAKKIIIYGSEGIGKTTLASQFPGAVFSDTEGSTRQLDVQRFNAPDSWDELLEQVDAIASGQVPCQTYVIDTADWAERLCIQAVCANARVDGIEAFGYGKGYVYVEEAFKKLLDKLNSLIKKGINIILVAHAIMRKFEQPDELGAYDRWEMKLSKKVGPLCKEWADMILFCNYRTILASTKGSDKKKAIGDERVMYTVHNACWDAKNRFGLDPVLPMEYKAIAHLFTNAGADPAPKTNKKAPKPKQEAPVQVTSKPAEEVHQETTTQASPAAPINIGDVTGLPDELVELMQKNAVSAFELKTAVTKYYPMNTPFTAWEDGFAAFVIQEWASVFDIIKRNREDLPF